MKLILLSKTYAPPLNMKETPLTKAVNLSTRLGVDIWLKREDAQAVFSFKIRGAYNFMSSLGEEEKWKGVVTCSAGEFHYLRSRREGRRRESEEGRTSEADRPTDLSSFLSLPFSPLFLSLGNHAQGVALAGYKLGIPCTIVMPLATPTIKWLNVERLGAKVVLFGDDFDQAKSECARLSLQHSLIYVPPYDDPLIIAGQGTVGLEILRQIPDPEKLDGVFGAIGGGGHVAGLCAYIKKVAGPETKVYGVETVDGDAMKRSIAKGERVVLDEVGPFSDGTAVKVVGEECFRICNELVDGIELCTNDEICAAIKDVFEGE